MWYLDTVSCCVIRAIYTNNIKGLGGRKRVQKATEKEKASNKLKALENLIRSCAVAISFFHLKPVAEYETTKGNRIRYAVKSKDGSNLIWDSKTGETFKSLKALGQELIEKAKWVSPATSAGKTTGNSGNAGTAASTAVSIVDLAEKAKATDNKFPDAFVQLCSSVCTLLDVKPLDQLSENEQKAFRNLEMTVIRKVFGDAKGVVDVGLINELYNKPADAAEKAKELQDAPKPDQTVAGNEKAARKPRKGNGKLMTAVEAENLKAPNAVKNDAETKAA